MNDLLESENRKATLDFIHWYWAYGIQREGRFACSAHWADQLYQLHAACESIERAETIERTAVAVWGPSQTGKSTLLARYIDAGADELGHGSALHWEGGAPARFVVANRDADAVVLNPYNFQSDGSGCVSRFTVKDSVPHPQHPVQIQLATYDSLLLALAMGYWTECDTVIDGRRRLWSEDNMSQLFAEPPTAKRSREGFELAHRTMAALELLLATGLSRYENLRPCADEFRRRFLDEPGVIGSKELAETSTHQLLWDGKRGLTDLLNQLLQKKKSLEAMSQGRPVYCSLAVAALLLDIDSYRKANRAGQASQRVRTLIEALRCQQLDDCILLGFDEGQTLCTSIDDFGLLQGLVWELQIPLCRVGLSANAKPLEHLLDRADLLDFPGVARAQKNEVKQGIQVETLTDHNRIELLTEVLKRGKTASIVASYAKGLSITAFSLLSQALDPPAKPAQLTTGISTWWRYFDPQYSAKDRLPSPLPLNLVLTFAAKLINPVIHNGVNDGLNSAFDLLKELDVLADPDIITHTLATNYPQFIQVEGSVDSQQRAVGEILDDPAFRRQFNTPEGKESLRQAASDGGTDHLLQLMASQSSDARRESLIRQRRAEILPALQTLGQQALPSEAMSATQRRAALMAWHAELNTKVRAKDADLSQLSYALRSVLDCDAGTLDPVPCNLQTDVQRVRLAREYASRQLEHWRQSRANLPSETLATIGVPDKQGWAALIYHLSQAVAIPKLADWLLRNFPALKTEAAARTARRFVATKISNSILNGSRPRAPHKDTVEITDDLSYFTENETASVYTVSPHYFHFLGPLLERIQSVGESNGTEERPPQPGDEEMTALMNKYFVQENA